MSDQQCIRAVKGWLSLHGMAVQVVTLKWLSLHGILRPFLQAASGSLCAEQVAHFAWNKWLSIVWNIHEVLKDEIIHQNYKDEKGKEQTVELRRIAWWDAKGKRAYEFITNNFELDAAVIAEIYRYRWQIELFFKKLKQNFPLQYFVGDNQNAIEIQIWCGRVDWQIFQCD